MNSENLTPDEQFAAEHFRRTFPFCDVCRGPAVWSEIWGDMHATRQWPHGVPPHLDATGHQVTMRDWLRNVPR
jgi:hypothetical protein